MTTTETINQTSTDDIAKMIATRAERGRDLYLTKRQRIVRVDADEYLVPGSTGQRYTVHYGAGREDCDCTDYGVHGGQIACKHLVAVALLYAVRRKVRSTCQVCGVSSREQALVGLRGDRGRHGPRWCLPHHPESMSRELARIASAKIREADIQGMQ